jgi:hypothetical protein
MSIEKSFERIAMALESQDETLIMVVERLDRIADSLASNKVIDENTKIIVDPRAIEITPDEVKNNLKVSKVGTIKSEPIITKSEPKKVPSITKDELNKSLGELYKAAGNSKKHIDKVFKDYKVEGINGLKEDQYVEFLSNVEKETNG